jgi:hypothetical protein
MKLLQKLMEKLRGLKSDVASVEEVAVLKYENELLYHTIAGLEESVALLYKTRVEQRNEAIKVIAALTLQHGGEMVLDKTFLEMVNDNTQLKVEATTEEEAKSDNLNKSTRYTIIQMDEESDEGQLPAGYDLVDDEGQCPDCGTLPGERGGEDCNACE